MVWRLPPATSKRFRNSKRSPKRSNAPTGKGVSFENPSFIGAVCQSGRTIDEKRLTKTYISAGRVKPRPNLPYVRHGTEETFSFTDFRNPNATYRSPSDGANSELCSLVANGTEDTDGLKSASSIGLNAKVVNQQGWGENLAQANKTISGASRLVKVTASLLHRDFKGAASHLGLSWNRAKPGFRNAAENGGGLASLWLEWSFGWSPLMDDFFATAETFVRRNWKHVQTETKVKETDHNLTKVTGTYGVPSGHVHEVVKSGITYQLTNGGLYTLESLGLINPAVVAWNLVPYSFVVDYFYDISALIGSTTMWSGLDLLDGFQTSYRKGEGDYLLVPSNSLRFARHIESHRVERAKWLGSVTIARKRWSTSWQRQANVFALLVTNLVQMKYAPRLSWSARHPI